MSLAELKIKIDEKSARLAIIGLGYVGLPVACEFARAGFDTLGIDIVADRVSKINTGISPMVGDEPGLADLLSTMINNGQLRATTRYADLVDRDIVLVAVETPVDQNNQPHYHALRSALESLGPVLKEGALVIIESTIAPRTMHDLVHPALEKSTRRCLNRGFFLGNCPERVMPGKLLSNLRHVSRVVGGMTAETASVMVDLYQNVVDADLDPTDSLTAELVKTTENAYRDVQIAFANEVALVCEAVGGDVWKVRELVNKSPGRQMLLPGAGVGGHCIPKDPWLLVANVRDQFYPQVIPAARSVNNDMPLHMAMLAIDALREADFSINGARVVVLGYAYLENSDDTRATPSKVLVDRLTELGARVIVHDPYVPEYQGDLEATIKDCHALIIMVRHSQYLELSVEQLNQLLALPVVIDGRHVFDPVKIMSAGFFYRGIGIARKGRLSGSTQVSVAPN